MTVHYLVLRKGQAVKKATNSVVWPLIHCKGMLQNSWLTKLDGYSKSSLMELVLNFEEKFLTGTRAFPAVHTKISILTSYPLQRHLKGMLQSFCTWLLCFLSLLKVLPSTTAHLCYAMHYNRPQTLSKKPSGDKQGEILLFPPAFERKIKP